QANLQDVVDAARRLKTKLVLIAETGQDSRHYLTNGVNGVIYRNVSGEALVQCVRKVNKGETWVQDTHESKETAENDLVGARVRDRLTAKELKIVALIVQGYKNKEITVQLGTTEQVIKNYLRNVYDKIGVSDRLELSLFTIHHRILAEASATSVAAGTRKEQAPGHPRHAGTFGAKQKSSSQKVLSVRQHFLFSEHFSGSHFSPPINRILIGLQHSTGTLPRNDKSLHTQLPEECMVLKPSLTKFRT